MEYPVTAPATRETCHGLSPFERLWLAVFGTLALVSASVLVYERNDATLRTIPRDGGVFREAIVGTPRFVNPLLAVSDADHDVAAIVYAGLMTRDSAGALVPELAEKVQVSDDGLTYTCTLRPDLTFHDGTPLTAADVAFTYRTAANPLVRSPLLSQWERVGIETPDDHTVVLTLPYAYAPFPEQLTLGILPAHIWGGLAPDEFSYSQFNSAPVGAGPYRIGEITRDAGGIPTAYALTAFTGYVLGTPHIAQVSFTLVRSEADAVAAYRTGQVDATAAITPATAEALLQDQVPNTAVLRTPLLHVFGLFMNHNRQPLFLDDAVRRALDEATPRQYIVGQVLVGYGTALTTLSMPGLSTWGHGGTVEEATTTQPTAYDQARITLTEAGWEVGADGVRTREARKKGEATQRLAFSLATVNVPELVRTASIVADAWRSLGADVQVSVLEPGDLAQQVLRPRRYDVLLFGEVLGHEDDLYTFWHSSERDDPGLNIAQYADVEGDALLEEARGTNDYHTRMGLYEAFASRLREQHAAIFLYVPDSLYVVRTTLGRVTLHPLTDPSERFDTIHDWYLETDRVWPFVGSFLEHRT